MGRVLKLIFFLIVAGFVGLIGFAYYPGNLAPDTAETTQPVVIHAQ